MIARATLTRREFQAVVKDVEKWERENYHLTASFQPDEEGTVVVEGEIAPLCLWLGQHDFPLQCVRALPYRVITILVQECESFTEEKLDQWVGDMLARDADGSMSPQGDWFNVDGYHIS